MSLITSDTGVTRRVYTANGTAHVVVWEENIKGAITGLPTTNGRVGTFPLDNTGATQTVVSNTSVTTNTLVDCFAMSVNGAAAVGSATGVYHDKASNVAGTSFTIKHAASPGATATMGYIMYN